MLHTYCGCVGKDVRYINHKYWCTLSVCVCVCVCVRLHLIHPLARLVSPPGGRWTAAWRFEVSSLSSLKNTQKHLEHNTGPPPQRCRGKLSEVRKHLETSSSETPETHFYHYWHELCKISTLLVQILMQFLWQALLPVCVCVCVLKVVGVQLSTSCEKLIGEY